MNARRWTSLFIAIGLLLVSTIYQFSMSSVKQEESLLGSQDKLFNEKEIKKGSFQSKIAVLNLEGIIQDSGEVPFFDTFSYNHKKFLKMIEKAGEDASV